MLPNGSNWNRMVMLIRSSFVDNQIGNASDSINRLLRESLEFAGYREESVNNIRSADLMESSKKARVLIAASSKRHSQD